MSFADQKRAMQAGDHHLGLAGWAADNGDPDNFLYQLLDSTNAGPGKLNYARYREYEYHKLVLAGRETTDRTERIRYYHQAQEILAKTAPWVPLAHTKIVIALRREVSGFVAHPSAILNLSKVSLK